MDCATEDEDTEVFQEYGDGIRVELLLGLDPTCGQHFLQAE